MTFVPPCLCGIFSDIVKILGDILLVLFIVSLLGVAGAMLLKEEGIAERLGNGAYLCLLAASIAKFIYHRRYI